MFSGCYVTCDDEESVATSSEQGPRPGAKTPYLGCRPALEQPPWSSWHGSPPITFRFRHTCHAPTAEGASRAFFSCSSVLLPLPQPRLCQFLKLQRSSSTLARKTSDSTRRQPHRRCGSNCIGRDTKWPTASWSMRSTATRQGGAKLASSQREAGSVLRGHCGVAHGGPRSIVQKRAATGVAAEPLA